MKNIFLHGLGSTHKNWDEVAKILHKNGIGTICPNLFEISSTKDYKNIFEAFCKFCNDFDDKLNLCGISFGTILALDYAKKYPQNVNYLIITATPYKIPKFLFMIQSLIFGLTPSFVFKN